MNMFVFFIENIEIFGCQPCLFDLCKIQELVMTAPEITLEISQPPQNKLLASMRNLMWRRFVL